MICQKFEALSHYEKVQFLGKLTHASQSDDVLFEIANEIIRQGEQRGLFDKVSFIGGADKKQPEDKKPTD